MRTVLLIALSFLALTSASAQTRQEVLRDLAYVGDFHAIEVALTDAHQQTLRGEISFQELRDLVIALTTTHPTVLETTDAWLLAMPDSPYANALRAFQLRDIAWALRGEATGRNTPRDALQTFADFHAKAMTHAVRAYEAAPDYVPASDAIFRLQHVTDYYGRAEYLAIVDDVMRVTPNIGSLKRSADFARRGWGGRGQSDVFLLCDQHASKIPDETYDFEVCVVHLGGATARPIEQADAWRRLGEKHHEALDWLRAWNLTAGSDRPRTDADRAMVEAYLTGAGSEDHKMAWRYMRSYPRTDQMDAILLDVIRSSKRYARDMIVHDPFDPELIKILLGAFPIFSYIDYEFERDFDDPNEPNLKARMAVARPFHPESWRDAAWGFAWDLEGLLELKSEPYFINSIYYSDHAPFAMEELLMYRFDAYWHAAMVALGGETIASDFDDMNSKWVCPIVRLSRMIDHECRQLGLGAGTCPELMQMTRPAYRTIVDNARENGLCEAEHNSTIAALRFEPVEVNLEVLSQPLVFD